MLYFPPNITQLTGDVSATGPGVAAATIAVSSVQNIVKNALTNRTIYVSADVGNNSTGDGSLTKPFKTIQKGIDIAAAIPSTYNTPVMVQVSPQIAGSGYSENLTITQQGIVLASCGGSVRNDLVTIFGTVTMNATGTAGGGNLTASQNNLYMYGFQVAPSTGNAINFSGSTFQRLFVSNCILGQSSTGSALVHSNTGTNSGLVSTITIRDCDIKNTSSSNPTISQTAGNIFIAGANPSITNSTAGGTAISVSGNSFTLNNGSIVGMCTNPGTGSITITNSTIASATTGAICSVLSSGSLTIGAASITNTTSTGSGISNTAGTITVLQTLFNIGTGSGAYVAKGTGLFVYALNSFVSNKNLQNTLTIVPLATTPTTGS